MDHEGVLDAAPLCGHDAVAVDIEQLVREESARIRALAWRFGVPEEELDDAVQEVFVRAWLGAPRFRGACAPSTWLTRIAVNYFVSRRRALMRRMRRMVRGEVSAEQPLPAQPRPEVREAHERAVGCIRRLPRRLREVFVLRYLEEMPCKEVAETLTIPEATVRTRAYHARRRLRAMLKGFEP